MGRGTGVRAASDTSIEIDFRYRGVRCQEKIKLAPTERNIAFATKLRTTILHEIAVGTFDYAQHFPKSPRARKLSRRPEMAVTVGELLTDWLKTVRAELEPETFKDYTEYVENMWRRRFGGDRLGDLTHAHVMEWIGEQTTSKKRVLNVLTPLRQALRYAVTTKLLAADPLAKLAIKRPAEIAEDVIDPFTPEEVAAVVQRLPAEVANAVTFWAWTGVRQGEMFGLLWSDVDLERGVVRITRALRDGRQKAPKTQQGVRDMALLPAALDALKRQREHTQLARKQVFLNPETREPWQSDKAFRKVWTAAVASAGVRYRFPRQLRHTFASWALGAGENPLWVSRVMGHTDPAFTMRVYSRYLPAMFPDAGALTIAAAARAGWSRKGGESA